MVQAPPPSPRFSHLVHPQVLGPSVFSSFSPTQHRTFRRLSTDSPSLGVLLTSCWTILVLCRTSLVYSIPASYFVELWPSVKLPVPLHGSIALGQPHRAAKKRLTWWISPQGSAYLNRLRFPGTTPPRDGPCLQATRWILGLGIPPPQAPGGNGGLKSNADWSRAAASNHLGQPLTDSDPNHAARDWPHRATSFHSC